MKSVQQHFGLASGLSTRSRNGNLKYTRPISYRCFAGHQRSSLSYAPSINQSNSLRLVTHRRNTSILVYGQSISQYSANADNGNEKNDDTSTKFLDKINDLLIGLKQGSVTGELFLLALPAILGQAVDPLGQMMETSYIGQIGALELASAGVGVSVFNIISKIFNMPLLSITTSFVAEDISKKASGQYISDGNSEKQSLPESQTLNKSTTKLELSSVSSALVLASIIGMIEASALFLGSGLFLKLMGVLPTSPMYSPAKLFLSLRALGAPANVLSLAVQGVLRGFKDTKTPLLCVGLGNLAAIGLLPVLVFGSHLGLSGAAIAIVISQYITTILLLWSLAKRAVLLPPRIGELQFGGYLKSGGMMLGRTLSIVLTMTIGTSMAARQGPSSMAAHQICLQLWLAVSLLSDALALSAQALIASSYAICDYKRVKEIVHVALKAGVLSGVALSIGMYASFSNIAKLFSTDKEVLLIVGSCALFVCGSLPINALAFVFDGLHYGVSDFDYAAKATMFVGTVSSFFMLYAPSKLGLAGVWAGLTLLMALRMGAGILRLQQRSGPWFFLHQKNEKHEAPDASDIPFFGENENGALKQVKVEITMHED